MLQSEKRFARSIFKLSTENLQRAAVRDSRPTFNIGAALTDVIRQAFQR